MKNEKLQKPMRPGAGCPATTENSCREFSELQAGLLAQLHEIDRQSAEVAPAHILELATLMPEAGVERAQPAIMTFQEDAGYVGLTALKVRRMLPMELFARSSEMTGLDGLNSAIFELYRRQWIGFTGSLANLPVPLELLYVIRARRAADRSQHSISIFFGVLALARTETLLAERCRENLSVLGQLIASTLRDVEIASAGQDDLQGLVEVLGGPAVEFSRRSAEISRRPVQTEMETRAGEQLGAPAEAEVSTIVPWNPPEDSWNRLLSVLAMQPGPAAMVVHARVMPLVPGRLHEEVRSGLQAMEGAADEGLLPMPTNTPLPRHAAATVLEAGSQQLLTLGGPLIAARIFAVGTPSPSPVLLATISTLLHACDAAGGTLPGGTRMKRASCTEIFQRLSEPQIGELYSPAEAIAFLRTPIPVASSRWIDIVNVRSAAPRGQSGDDAPLGVSASQRQRTVVRMDRQTRCDHSYVIGQTGTGKSTFLLHQILHDIHQGHGVGVLDPHGTLIEEVLRRMPVDRADDLVILDPTDIERPVPFNPLAISERDPLEYRQLRDLVINDLFADVQHAYSESWSNISGPVFETHLHGVLGLLLGLEPQQAPWIPHLGIMRAVYFSAPLRKMLIERLNGRDFVVQDFVREAEAATGDQSLRNVSGGCDSLPA